MFLPPDLDRDLQEHPELPALLVSVDQGYVRDKKLYLYTRWVKANLLNNAYMYNSAGKAALLSSLYVTVHRNRLTHSYGMSKVNFK